MDQQNFKIPRPARPAAAFSGPKGLEGATQSGLDLRQACKCNQQLLEITEKGHAQSQSKAGFTHAEPMIGLLQKQHVLTNMMHSILIDLVCVIPLFTETVSSHVQVMNAQMYQGNFHDRKDTQSCFIFRSRKKIVTI